MSITSFSFWFDGFTNNPGEFTHEIFIELSWKGLVSAEVELFANLVKLGFPLVEAARLSRGDV